MNVRLHVVWSQIHGVRGRRISQALRAGERSARAWAAWCDAPILQHQREAVLKSLAGNWPADHLWALQQAVEGCECCPRQAVACDKQIAARRGRLTAAQPPPPPLEAGRKLKVGRPNAPPIDNLPGPLVGVAAGRAAPRLPGISPLGGRKLVGEIGADWSAGKSEPHVTSWLGLAPGRNQSGKRRQRRPRKKTVAGQLLREAVLSIAQSKSLARGAAERRLQARQGAPIAITAIARQLAVL